ncbi:hypothetical protein K439DRAFT_182255 [Ramaria rubella]|nr:hypothetical protein K439DRAFT_182255 [Ramaria rubella]
MRPVQTQYKAISPMVSSPGACSTEDAEDGDCISSELLDLTVPLPAWASTPSSNDEFDLVGAVQGEDPTATTSSVTTSSATTSSAATSSAATSSATTSSATASSATTSSATASSATTSSATASSATTSSAIASSAPTSSAPTSSATSSAASSSSSSLLPSALPTGLLSALNSSRDSSSTLSPPPSAKGAISPAQDSLSKINTGAVVGGVLGGLILITLAAIAFFLLHRRRKMRTAPSAEFYIFARSDGPRPAFLPGLSRDPAPEKGQGVATSLKDTTTVHLSQSWGHDIEKSPGFWAL